MRALGWAAVVLAGVGPALLAAGAPTWRTPSLDSRLAPWTAAATGTDEDVPSMLAVVRAALGLRPAPHRAPGRQGVPADPRLARRLARSGGAQTVLAFRTAQMQWAVVAAIIAALGGALVSGSAVSGLGAAVAGAGTALWWSDRRLTRRIRRREEQMALELPALAELLCLAVTAGESPIAALERAGERCHGAMGQEVRSVVAGVRAGDSLTRGLERLAADSEVPSIGRLVGAVLTAAERGTPLADVLQAQAREARDERRRRLMEIGGRREIAMTAPVVFLVLPVTVAFAAYPALAALDLG